MKIKIQHLVDMESRKEWLPKDVEDFFSDFLDVYAKDAVGSAGEVANAFYADLIRKGEGKVNAHLMADGVRTFLIDLARKHL